MGWKIIRKTDMCGKWYHFRIGNIRCDIRNNLNDSQGYH